MITNLELQAKLNAHVYVNEVIEDLEEQNIEVANNMEEQKVAQIDPAGLGTALFIHQKMEMQKVGKQKELGNIDSFVELEKKVNEANPSALELLS